jgi:hypothetical protein
MRYLARLLKNPIVGSPKIIDSMLAAQGLNGELYLTEPYEEASGTIGVSGDISPPRPSPRDVIKSARPFATCFCLNLGARGSLRQDGEP